MLFSTGTTPYWQSPASMAENTASNELKYSTFASPNSLSHASCDYAPATPWQATAARCGNSFGVCSMAAWISSVSADGFSSSRF